MYVLEFAQTNHRITEGSADEYGSYSFNQVLYMFRFGHSPCLAHSTADLNYFKPNENIQGFVVHLAGKAGGGCDNGSFYSAYAQNNQSHNHNMDDLVGYRQNSDTVHAIGSGDDDYEVFSKAVAGYNGGLFFGNRSWASWLKTSPKPETKEPNSSVPNSTKNTFDTQCFSCQYAIEVKNGNYGLPYRDYIWLGEEAVEDDLNTPEDETRAAWCFVYGEREWIDGKKWSVVKKNAAETPLRPATGQINCQTGKTI